MIQFAEAFHSEAIVVTLSRQLVRHYGQGFAEKNLRRMVQFATLYPEEQIVVSLTRQLSWSHVLALLPLKEPLQREFYVQMCAVERWSVRTLRERIDSMLYERTALSQQPKAQIEQELATLRDTQRMSPALLLRDPYVLDFLGLRDTWAESDLEAAILREMESFLLELGAGFSFVSRQHRITLDGEDFHLDLLFYNRKLRRLVAVELKVSDFKAGPFRSPTIYSAATALPPGFIEGFANKGGSTWSSGICEATLWGGYVRAWSFTEMVLLRRRYGDKLAA